MNLDFNDPRLTAFALHEMDADERAEFEAELEQTSGVRAAIADIQETVGCLRVGFAAEEAAMSGVVLESNVIRPAFWQRSGVRALFVAAAGVAACFALTFVAIRDVQEKKARLAEQQLRATESGEEEIGEFRITIAGEKKRGQRAAPELAGDAEKTPIQPKILPEREIPGLPAGLPAPRVQFASTLDPLPEHLRELRFIDPLYRKVSTFPFEVGNSSLSLVRHNVENGQLPPRKDVRVEELVNAFAYDYAPPKSGSAPFRVHLEVAECPWQPGNRLVKIGVQSRFSRQDGPIAQNPAILVDFNPLRVSGYRLIGQIEPISSDEAPVFDRLAQPGHSVTAFYEIIPLEAAKVINPRPKLPKNSGKMASLPPERRFEIHPELLTVKLTFQAANGLESEPIEAKLVDSGAKVAAASEDFRFAAAVAAFGEWLSAPDSGDYGIEQIVALAESGVGDDASGQRSGFVNLVRKAGDIW